MLLVYCRFLFIPPPHGATAPSGLGPPHYRGFTTTLGRTPLEEWSALRKDLYLTTHNTHNRQTSMLTEGFEPTIPVSERLQTHALDCAATGIGRVPFIGTDYWNLPCKQLNVRGELLSLVLGSPWVNAWWWPCYWSLTPGQYKSQAPGRRGDLILYRVN
jgi:hypothetical protein